MDNTKEVCVAIYGDSSDDEYGYLYKGWEDLTKEQQDKFLEMNPDFDPSNIQNKFWTVSKEWMNSLDEKYGEAFDLVADNNINSLPPGLEILIDEESIETYNTSEIEIENVNEKELEEFKYGIAYEGEGEGYYAYYFELDEDEEFDIDKLKILTTENGTALRGIIYDGETYTENEGDGTSNTNWCEWKINFANVIKK